jgi:hypothetical protein
MVFDDSTITLPSQGLVGLDYSTRYYWRVQAWSDTATSEWSEVWTFETVPPPAGTELIAPVDAAQDVPISPELTWNRVPDAIGYRIQISNWDPYFQSVVVDDSTITAPSYRPAGLDSNTRYYWRVRPIVPGIASPWSVTWYFTTAAPNNLLPTAQIYPPDKSRISSDSIRFIWDRSPLPLATYRLEISYDDTFARSFLDSTLADTTALLSARYFGQQEYWWRVWVIDPAGKEVSSTQWSFQTVPGTSGVGGTVASGNFRLDQNIPNPSGDMTTVAFRLPLRQHLVLRLVDLNGNELQRPVDATLDAGEHTVGLNTSRLASGTYLCLLTSEGVTLAQRVIVLH